jgi:hypothetical protein
MEILTLWKRGGAAAEQKTIGGVDEYDLIIAGHEGKRGVDHRLPSP